MEGNSVHLAGTVKRDATAGTDNRGTQILDFALQVTNPATGRYDIFDCRLTSNSMAMETLEGFVSEGEPLEIVGHLERHTTTDRQRMSYAWVEVRMTQTIVFVDEIINELE